MPVQQTASSQQFNLDQFLYDTQSQRIALPQMSWSELGQTQLLLPQGGLGAMLTVNINMSFTVNGTITGGTFQGYSAAGPAPFSILPNVNFKSNQQTSLDNMSLYTWYKWTRQRYNRDLPNEPAGQMRVNNNAAIGAYGTTGLPVLPNAAVTAKTYNFLFSLPLPFAYNRALSTGLISLASNAVQYTLTFQWGSIAAGIGATGGTNGLFNGLTGSGISITNVAVNVSSELESFILPTANVPPESMVLSIQDQSFPITGGPNVFQLPPNDLITMLMIDVYNNGNVGPTNIAAFWNEIIFQYVINQRKFDETVIGNLAYTYWEGGAIPLDGCFVWDLGIRKTSPYGQNRDIYEAFNAASVTALQVQANALSSFTPTAPSGVIITTEALKFVAQQ